MLGALEEQIFSAYPASSFQQTHVTIGFGRWRGRPEKWISFGDVEVMSRNIVEEHERNLVKLDHIISTLLDTGSSILKKDEDELYRQNAAEGLLQLTSLHIADEPLTRAQGGGGGETGGGLQKIVQPLTRVEQHGGAAIRKVERPLSRIEKHGGIGERVEPLARRVEHRAQPMYSVESLLNQSIIFQEPLKEE